MGVLMDNQVVKAEGPRLEAKVLGTGRAAVLDPLAVIKGVQDKLNYADNTVERVKGAYEHAGPLREYTR